MGNPPLKFDNMSQFHKNLSALNALEMKDNKRAYLNVDSREVLKSFLSNSVNAVITSPPYGNVKNYGTVGEIGYGRSFENEYFLELQDILTHLHRITVDGGAFWLILDMFRYKSNTIALPFELMERARRSGWHFQDMIVWDKGRNLPWSHSGKFRSVSEHILLFSKGGKLNHFNIDELRTTEGLSTYWVKYPERFHPEGKAPSDIWHIPIPTQGSWSTDNKAAHFCPFPIELINRMVALTTEKGDLILDPFCGTGTVLVSANSLDRYALGIDINNTFYDNYNNYGSEALEKEAFQFVKKSQNDLDLRQTIIHLRANKYAASLFKEFSKLEIHNDLIANNILYLIVNSLNIYKYRKGNSFATLKLFVVSDISSIKKISEEVLACKSRAPLSKFGLDVEINVISSTDAKNYFIECVKQHRTAKIFYLYKQLRFNYFTQEVSLNALIQNFKQYTEKRENNLPIIISPLKLQITPNK